MTHQQHAILTKKKQFLKKRKLIFLLALVIVASITLVTLNYYTIKTMSAVRAYINGESEYSKGQKDALLYLTSYIQSGEEHSWASFRASLQIPMGDNIARHHLANHADRKLAVNGFVVGKNKPADIDGMIWLFTSFKSVSFMKEAITIWADAEPLINRLSEIGEEVHQKMLSGKIPPSVSSNFIAEIETISAALTEKERAFSNTLGAAGRTISDYLFYVNAIFTILIVSLLSGYVISIINKLLVSEQALQVKNAGLTHSNRELDSFVYSASHDLRSPINSLKGLVQLAVLETEPGKGTEYLAFMGKVIDQLDLYIRELIDFSRNKNTSIKFEEISLVKMVEEALNQLKFMPEASRIRLETAFGADVIYSDPVRIKMILNNLLSNAVKYSDPAKPESVIRLKTARDPHNYTIEVGDNGIGINKQFHGRIFDMFFVTNSKKGTGLGLYIIKETIEKLSGTIRVESEEKVGSTFFVTIPVRQMRDERF